MDKSSALLANETNPLSPLPPNIFLLDKTLILHVVLCDILEFRVTLSRGGCVCKTKLLGVRHKTHTVLVSQPERFFTRFVPPLAGGWHRIFGENPTMSGAHLWNQMFRQDVLHPVLLVTAMWR